MSQNPQRPKTKIEPKLESVIQVKLPMIRDFSTGGGHGPGNEIIEGKDPIITKKWQGYPPDNLKVVGKPMPPLAEVAIPRFLGKAEYASRVILPNMLHAKVLTSPHPHARIKSMDTAVAEKMPGVAHILTYKNSLKTSPLSEELHLQGDIVAVIAAETEDLAEDAAEAIRVEYDVLDFATTVQQVMAANAPDLRNGKGNLVQLPKNNFHYDASASWVAKQGDIEKGFADAAMVREYTYYFAGAAPVPIQPCGCVAKWDGDKLTLWGMSQGIYPMRNALARQLGMDQNKIRFIDKYNGCTFGGASLGAGAEVFYPFIAQLAKVTGRPVKLMLPKDQELAHLHIKPENITKFKVGMDKAGKVTSLLHEVHLSAGDLDATWGGGNAADATELYTFGVPHWKSVWFNYRTNSIRLGCTRSCSQQEAKWAWESFVDEIADELGIDPVQYRIDRIPRPGPVDLSALEDQADAMYDSFASIEVLQEGAKAIGWDKRNPKPGTNPGRFKRGLGMGMSMHHNGHMGYHDGEAYFEKFQQGANGGAAASLFGAEVEVGADGNVIMKNALPDSGTNHDTALAALVSEMLGFTTRDHVHVVWGDSETAPSSDRWRAGMTITLQGAALCSATDKLRKDLLHRASEILKVDMATLQVRDGVISASDDAKKRTTFAALVAANKGPIRQVGWGGFGERVGKARNKGVGACFVEVEVDSWTGDWRFVRSVYSHDVGLVVNPMVGEADMHGSLVQSWQMTTDPIPWDREFPGTRHYSVGYLSYRIPTIMDVPESQTQVFIDSLEPRWFYGTKSFSETTIGAVPGALANAIYNACGVRIREHPITKDKIMAGIAASKKKS